MIDTILFDWGGVFNPQHESLTGYHAIAQQFGQTPEALYELLYSGDEWRQARIGGLSSRGYWSTMQARLGFAGELEAFLEVLFAGEVINPTLVTLARHLRGRYRVGLLSNALDDLEELLEHKWQVMDCFDVVVNSARLGAAKPDSAAFHAALEALEAQPATTLFIDDKARNVVAAQALGIPTIHYTTAPALLADLVQRGILTVAEQERLLDA